MIASAAITPSARRLIEESFEGNRQIVLIDLDRLLTLLRQYQLHRYVLFSDRPGPGQKVDPKPVAAKRKSSKTAKIRR